MRAVKHVVRRLSRAPMFTVTAMLTLAIGIAANTSIFSVINGILLKPLPYPEADRLIGVSQTAPGINIRDLNASPATYYTYREENRTFEDIGMWSRGSASVTGVGEPEQVRTLIVTDGVLPVLRVSPFLGRAFTKQDDAAGAPRTAILSHGYWQRKFGGDPNVIGRKLVIDGQAADIVGVMPADFRFSNTRPDILIPFQLDRSRVFIGNFSYHTIARLKPGVTIAQANADVARMIPMLSQKFQPPGGMNFKMLTQARLGPNLRPFKNDVVGDVGKVLWVLMGTVGVVLLIACANIANLLLVRMDGRQQEFAIRTAMGANRRQIGWEMMMESLALGTLGGAIGVLISYGALKLLVRIGPANLPRREEITIDGAVLAFSLLASILSAVVFGLIPIFRYAGSRVATTLRTGGRTMSEGRERHRTRGALVVVQVALAIVLLISSGLMMRTISALHDVKPGFQQPDEVLTLRISVPSSQVPQPERVARMYNDIVERIGGIPGVTSTAVANSITMDGSISSDPIYAEDRAYSDSELPAMRRYKYVGPGMFNTLRNPIVAGRDLTWTDIHETRQVVLVSENLAREFWGSPTAALGKRIREKPNGVWREIVGVVGNEHDSGVHQAPPTIVYWPLLIRSFWQQELEMRRSVAIAVRSKRARSSGLLQDVQKAIWAVNPELPVAEVRTLREIYDMSMARTSFTAVMLAIAAGAALFLGIIGIYGVISYSISQRTREIGIRMALGASQANVRRLFVRYSLMLTVIGVLCGIAASVPLTRLMGSLLYGTSPVDPITYGAVAILLICAAVLAAYLPARRATIIQPLDALRSE